MSTPRQATELPNLPRVVTSVLLASRRMIAGCSVRRHSTGKAFTHTTHNCWENPPRRPRSTTPTHAHTRALLASTTFTLFNFHSTYRRFRRSAPNGMNVDAAMARCPHAQTASQLPCAPGLSGLNLQHLHMGAMAMNGTSSAFRQLCPPHTPSHTS